MATHVSSPREEDRIIDLDTFLEELNAPVPGAQWDEVHGRWQHWDELMRSWLFVGSETPVRLPVVAPDAAMGATTMVVLVPEDDRQDQIIDIDRLAPPHEPVPGAHWNEVMGRWERWDDVASGWIAIPSNVDAF